MCIRDSINDAISNAITRRGLVEETLFALSDEETAGITGGLNAETAIVVHDSNFEIAVAGFKQVEPIYSPIKPSIKPICLPTKPIIKPICPPVVAGLIFIPYSEKSLDS